MEQQRLASHPSFVAIDEWAVYLGGIEERDTSFHSGVQQVIISCLSLGGP